MATSFHLSELCEQIVDCPHSTPKWTDEGVIVLRNQNIRNGRLDLSNPSYTDEVHYSKRTKRAVPQPNDLVITREAPMGEVCMIPEGLRCCLGQRMVLLRPNKSMIDPRYLLYTLQSRYVQHEIGINEGTGSTVSNLRIPLIEALSIPYCSLPEQRTIAHILGTLDDKIELNRRMNQTLEAMARAIYKSWFVDFDPVRAKAEGLDVGLPEEIVDLFPDSFEETELGEVPKGWDVSKLSDVCKYITSGGTPNTKMAEYWNGDIPWLSSGETRNPFIHVTEKTITNLGVEKSSTKLAREKSTVIASAGQGQTRGQASLLLFDSYINQSVVTLVADNKHVSDYYLFFNLSNRYEELRRISDSHSSRGSLTTKLLNNLKIVVPSLQLISKFDKFTETLITQIHHNLLTSDNLIETRDTLLPKLLSGELQLNDSYLGEVVS